LNKKFLFPQTTHTYTGRFIEFTVPATPSRVKQHQCNLSEKTQTPSFGYMYSEFHHLHHTFKQNTSQEKGENNKIQTD